MDIRLTINEFVRRCDTVSMETRCQGFELDTKLQAYSQLNTPVRGYLYVGQWVSTMGRLSGTQRNGATTCIRNKQVSRFSDSNLCPINGLRYSSLPSHVSRKWISTTRNIKKYKTRRLNKNIRMRKCGERCIWYEVNHYKHSNYRCLGIEHQSRKDLLKKVNVTCISVVEVMGTILQFQVLNQDHGLLVCINVQLKTVHVLQVLTVVTICNVFQRIAAVLDSAEDCKKGRRLQETTYLIHMKTKNMKITIYHIIIPIASSISLELFGHLMKQWNKHPELEQVIVRPSGELHPRKKIFFFRLNFQKKKYQKSVAMCDFHTFSFNNVKDKVVLPVFIQFRVNDSMKLNAVLGNSKLGSIHFQGKRGYMTSWESTTKEAARICGIALKRKNFTDCWFINVNGKEYSMTQALKAFVFEDNLFDRKLPFQFSVNCTCCQLFQTSNQDGCGDKALTGRTMKSRQNQISDDSKPKNESGLKIRVSLSDPDSGKLVAESNNKQNRYKKIELTNPVEVVKETKIVINPISPSKHGKRQTSKKSATDNGKKKPTLDPNDLSNWLYSSEEDDDDFCWTPKDLVWLDENVETLYSQLSRKCSQNAQSHTKILHE